MSSGPERKVLHVEFAHHSTIYPGEKWNDLDIQQ